MVCEARGQAASMDPIGPEQAAERPKKNVDRSVTTLL
jgi:hypothetical protein